MPPSTQSKIEMCLHFTAFSPIRLTINQLRSAISTPEALGSRLDDDNMVSEQDIEFMCGSLFRKTDNGVFFEFAHVSVRDFLEHESLAVIPGLKKYQISRERCNDMLASQSLRFLQLSNFDVELPDLESLINRTQYPVDSHRWTGPGFHPVAASLSVQLSRKGQPDSTAASLLKSLFHPRKSSCFLIFATNLCAGLVNYYISFGLIPTNAGKSRSELAEKFLHDEFQPIHLAAALNLPEVCQHLVDAGSNLAAESPVGSPLNLSVTSFLRLILNDGDIPLIEKHPHHLYSPIRTLLGRYHQRNATFKIFEHTKLQQLALDSTRRPGETPLVVHALIIAFAENNFWILQKLLDRGMTLEHTTYTRLFPNLISQSLPEIRKNEQPLLAFLQDLGSRLEAESGWPLEIGRLIWRTAVELGLTFTKDPTVTDLRISLSKDALVSRAFVTIKGRDMKGLQECITDGRLDLSERHRDPMEPQEEDDALHLTLLHFAVLENNLQATTHLAQAGCDPNIHSIRIRTLYRYLPIHDCLSIDLFEVLLAHGASATDIEVHTGKTIWHMYAMESDTEIRFFQSIDFFESIARRLPAETAEALLTKSKDGHTPLQLLLVSRYPHIPREDLVERVMALVAICQGVADFWSRHEPIFAAAAAFGSEKVIRRLIEVGAGIESISIGRETPLHRISIESTSASVEILKEIIPKAVHIRFEGHLPIQAYLKTCVFGQHPIDDTVAQQLCTAESLRSIDGKGTTLWEYYCDFNTTGTDILNQSSNTTLWAWLLSNDSAMQVYEHGSSRSGLVLFLSRLIRLDEIGDLTSTIPSAVLDHAINSTYSWETVKSDSEVLRFLQFCIKKLAYSLVSALIARGVSVCDQVDGYSSIQFAFQSPLVFSLCSGEQGKDMLINMLDHATLEHLNNYDRDGLTVLHRFATGRPGLEHEIEWLIRTLVNKGVDIDKMGLFRDQGNPIFHHICKGSVFGATCLLQMGADPGLAHANGPNATLEASFKGSITFLSHVLEHSKKPGVVIDWKRKAGLWLRQGTKDLSLGGINAIHYASAAGSLEVLEFYVNNGLIDGLEIPSAEGWTAMHLAAARGHAHLIEYLGSKGCGIMPQTNDKTTPLHLSVYEKHYKATEALIRLGARDVPDNTGVTPTMYAFKCNDKSMLQLLGKILPPETSLTQDFARDALPRKRLKPVATALEKAVKYDDMEECKRLCSIGCPVNISIKGLSPLILALHNGHADIVEWLLDKGATTTSRLCH